MVERFKNHLKNYSFSGPKTIVIILVILAVLTVLIFNGKKTIVVSIDGKDKEITTFSNTYRRALSNNGIVVGTKDKVTPSIDSKVTRGSKVFVKRAVNVKVAINGKQLNVQTAENNVEKMLTSENIKVEKFDKVYPSKNTPIKNGLKVTITKVETKNIKEDKAIDYATVIKEDQDMEKGNNKVLQEGKEGQKEVLTQVIYENGKEISRKIIAETIKKQPVERIVAMGSLSVYTPSRGISIPYEKYIRMRATAYTDDYESTGKGPGDPDFGITTSGTVAKRDEDGYSSVAVDPRIIPLGTKLYIDGYGYAIAEDTGGAIKGNRVDLFFNSSSEVDNWGVRWTNVYLIK